MVTPKNPDNEIAETDAPDTRIAKTPRIQQAEREEMYNAAFRDGKSQNAISREFNRHRSAVANVLTSPEGLERQEAIHAALRKAAVDKMVRHAGKAADSWIDSLQKAMDGEKAQHLPAKEFLTHIKALEVAAPNTDRGVQILIQIGGTPDGIEPEIVEAEIVND